MNLFEKFILSDSKDWMGFYKSLIDEQKIQLCIEASTEMKKAIENGNVEKLRVLSNLASMVKANSSKKLFAILKKDDENCNLIVHACKANKYKVLKFLFNTIKYCRKINEKDSEGKTAFYYAIKSNNVELLKTLVREWPYRKEFDIFNDNNSGKQQLEVMFILLKEPYVECKKELTSDMINYIQQELQFNRFQYSIYQIMEEKSADNEILLERMHKEISTIMKLVRLLEQYPNGIISNMDITYRSDVVVFSLIAKAIRFLKRELKYTYKDLPWEELEFYLSMILPLSSKQERIQLLLARDRYITEELSKLNIFQKDKSCQNTIVKKQVDLLQQGLKSDKEELHKLFIFVKSSIDMLKQDTNKPIKILKKFVEELFKIKDQITLQTLLPQKEDCNRNQKFKELYDLFDKIKDQHSIDRILHYLQLVTIVNPTEKLGQLVIQRALQIMGEYFKNSVESPNLSEPIRKILIALNLDIKKIEDLRDHLSHVYALLAREEVVKSNLNLFRDMQDELSKIKYILENINNVKDNKVKYRANVDAIIKFENIVSKRFFITLQEKQEALATIPQSKQNIVKEAKEKLIEFYDGELKLSENEYILLVDKLESVRKKELYRDYADQESWISCKQTVLISPDTYSKLNGFLEKSLAIPEKELLELLKKIEVEQKNYRLWQNVNKIFSGAQNRKLNFMNQYLSKLSVLQEILKDKFKNIEKVIESYQNNSDTYSDSELKLGFMQAYESDHVLQAAIEYLLLEIRELMKEQKIEELIGRPFLRNYLAHGDALQDALIFDPLTEIISDAITLLAEKDAIQIAMEFAIKIKAKNSKNLENIIKALEADTESSITKTLEIDFLISKDIVEKFIKLPRGKHYLSNLLRVKFKQAAPVSIVTVGLVKNNDFDKYYNEVFSWQTLEIETCIGNFCYKLQQSDIAEIARIRYGYNEENGFYIIDSLEQLYKILMNVHDVVPLTLLINVGQYHWVSIVITSQYDQRYAFYRDSYGDHIPEKIFNILKGFISEEKICVFEKSYGIQQTDSFNCGIFALQNAHNLTEFVLGNIKENECFQHFRKQYNKEEMIAIRENFADILNSCIPKNFTDNINSNVVNVMLNTEQSTQFVEKTHDQTCKEKTFENKRAFNRLPDKHALQKEIRDLFVFQKDLLGKHPVEVQFELIGQIGNPVQNNSDFYSLERMPGDNACAFHALLYGTLDEAGPGKGGSILRAKAVRQLLEAIQNHSQAEKIKKLLAGEFKSLFIENSPFLSKIEITVQQNARQCLQNENQALSEHNKNIGDIKQKVSPNVEFSISDKIDIESTYRHICNRTDVAQIDKKNLSHSFDKLKKCRKNTESFFVLYCYMFVKVCVSDDGYWLGAKPGSEGVLGALAIINNIGFRIYEQECLQHPIIGGLLNTIEITCNFSNNVSQDRIKSLFLHIDGIQLQSEVVVISRNADGTANETRDDKHVLIKTSGFHFDRLNKIVIPDPLPKLSIMQKFNASKYYDLQALNTAKQEFVDTLLIAIEDARNRELLTHEVEQAFINNMITDKKNSWLRIIENYQSSHEEFQDFLLKMKKKYHLFLLPENQEDQVKDHIKQYGEPNENSILTILMNNLQQWQNQRITFFQSKSIVTSYVKLYLQEIALPVSNKCLQLYVQARHLLNNIEKQDSIISSQSKKEVISEDQKDEITQHRLSKQTSKMLPHPQIRAVKTDISIDGPFIELADTLYLNQLNITNTFEIDDPTPASGYDITIEPWKSAKLHMKNLYQNSQEAVQSISKNLADFQPPILLPNTVDTKQELIQVANQYLDIRELGKFPDQYDPLIKIYGTEQHINIDDIFKLPIKKGAKTKLSQHILLQGRPGSGKTTVVDWLVQRWSCGEEPSNVFAWVFKIDLRILAICHRDLLLSSQTQITDIIHSYFFKNEKLISKKQVRSIIHKSKEILIILDGFNELPQADNLPGLKALLQSSFTTLITSRLFHSEIAQKYCDMIVNLLGFDEKSLISYVKTRAEVLAPSNPSDVNEQAFKLIAHLENKKVFWSFAHIPINIQWITHIWLQDNGNLDVLVELSTMTDLFNKITDSIIKGDLNKQSGNPRDPERTVEHTNAKKESIEFLEQLAFYAMNNKSWLISEEMFIKVFCDFFWQTRSISASKELAKILTKDSPFLNILVIQNNEQEERVFYSFTHAIFQEYFAGCYIAKQHDEYLQSFVCHYRFNPHYQMMMIFAVGKISRNAIQNKVLLPAMFQAINSLPMDVAGLQSVLLTISWLNECTSEFIDYLYSNHLAIYANIQQVITKSLFQTEQRWRDSLIDFFRYCPVVFFHDSVYSVITKALQCPEIFHTNNNDDSEKIIYSSLRFIHGINKVQLNYGEQLRSIITNIGYHYSIRFEAAKALGYLEKTSEGFILVDNLLSMNADRLWYGNNNPFRSCIGHLYIGAVPENERYSLGLKANLFVALGKLLKRNYRCEYVVGMINALSHALGEQNGYRALYRKQAYNPIMPYEFTAAIVSALGEIGVYDGTTIIGLNVVDIEEKVMMEILHFIALTLQSYQPIAIIKTGIRALDGVLKYNPKLISYLINSLNSNILYISIAASYSLLYLTNITSQDKQKCVTQINMSIATLQLDPLLEAIFIVVRCRLGRKNEELIEYLHKMIFHIDLCLQKMAIFFIAEFNINEPKIITALLNVLETSSYWHILEEALRALRMLGSRNAVDTKRIISAYNYLNTRDNVENKDEKCSAYLATLAAVGSGVVDVYDLLKEIFLDASSYENANHLISYGNIDALVLEKIVTIINGSPHFYSGGGNVCINANENYARLLGKLNLSDYVTQITEYINDNRFLPLIFKGTPLISLVQYFANTGKLLDLCVSKAVGTSIVLLYDEGKLKFIENQSFYSISIKDTVAKQKMEKLIKDRKLTRQAPMVKCDSTFYGHYNLTQYGGRTMPDSKYIKDLYQQAENLKIASDKLNVIHDKAESLTDAWLKSLVDNESAQFAQYPFFPTDYECAWFSEAVYNPLPLPEKELLPGWELIRIAINTQDGYVGAAYWNEVHRHLLIAHQGTNDVKKDLSTDINAVVRSNVDSQMASAAKFTIDTVSKLIDLSISITITGHSLGGWLAQITAYHLEEISIHAHTVVFESPGCADMLQKLAEGYDKTVRLEDLDITIYLSAPNYINTCGKHLESATLYHVPTDELPWDRWVLNVNGYIEHLRSIHNMEKLLNAFYPASGYPDAKFYRMLKWPLIEFPKHDVNNWNSMAVLNLFKDFIFSKDVHTDRLNDFLKFAKALGDLSLTDQGSLTFDSNYQLTYKIGYQKAPEDESTVIYKKAIFPEKIRNFLELYLQFKNCCTGSTAEFFLKANHERYQKQGYTRIRDLLDNYHLNGDRVIAENPVTFIRYLLHVTRINPDISILQSSAFEQITEVITKEKLKSSTAGGVIANQVGEAVIGHFSYSNICVNKDTPSEHVVLLIPIISELAKSERNLKNSAVPALFGQVDCLRVIRAFSDNVVFGSRIESIDEKAFSKALTDMKSKDRNNYSVALVKVGASGDKSVEEIERTEKDDHMSLSEQQFSTNSSLEQQVSLASSLTSSIQQKYLDTMFEYRKNKELLKEALKKQDNAKIDECSINFKPILTTFQTLKDLHESTTNNEQRLGQGSCDKIKKISRLLKDNCAKLKLRYSCNSVVGEQVRNLISQSEKSKFDQQNIQEENPNYTLMDRSSENSISKYNGIRFQLNQVLGDGDCGFTAFGITREEATKLLLSNIVTSQQVAELLKQPLKDIMFRKEFRNYVKQQGDFPNYVATFDAHVVAQGNGDTDQAKVHEQTLENYLNDANFLLCYINYDVRDKNVEAGWAHPAVLQALAEIRNLRLNIFTAGTDSLIPHKHYPTYPPNESARGEEINLLFINGNHFERLEFSIDDIPAINNPRSTSSIRCKPS